MKLKIIVFFFKVLEPPVDGHAVLEELAESPLSWHSCGLRLLGK